MHIGTCKDLKNTQSWKVQNCVCCSQFLFLILTWSSLLPWIQVEMEFDFEFLKNFTKVRCTPLLKFERLRPTPARASKA